MFIYTIEKREVTTVKNRHGRPSLGKEKRWYVLRDGQRITSDHTGYITPDGLYFSTKREALAEITALNDIDRKGAEK